MKPARIVVLAHRSRRRRHRRVACRPVGPATAAAGAGRANRNRRRSGRRRRHRPGHDRRRPDLRWQTWPAAAASPTFIRKSDRPDAINQLAGSIARAPFYGRRADPRNQADQGQGLRLHGRHPAGRHARDLDRDFAGDRRRRLHPAQRSRRRASCRAATRRPRRPPVSTFMSARRSSPTYACSRSTRRSRKRTASAWSSARPRRSSSLRSQAETLASGAPDGHAVARAAQHRRFRQQRGRQRRG